MSEFTQVFMILGLVVVAVAVVAAIALSKPRTHVVNNRDGQVDQSKSTMIDLKASQDDSVRTGSGSVDLSKAVTTRVQLRHNPAQESGAEKTTQGSRER